MGILKEHGTMVSGSDAKFVVADAVAKLSGVSLQQVRRVIAAQHALCEAQALEPRELIDYYATPQALPNRQRAMATEAVCEAMEVWPMPSLFIAALRGR